MSLSPCILLLSRITYDKVFCSKIFWVGDSFLEQDSCTVLLRGKFAMESWLRREKTQRHSPCSQQ